MNPQIMGGMGGGDGMGDESNDEELMEELLRAAEAGDDAEGEGFFSDVPGAEQQSGDVSIEAEGVKPGVLQQLLQALQEKKENGDTGDLSAGMP